MSKRTRLYLAVLAIVLALPLLAGCAGPATSDTASSGSAAEAKAPAEVSLAGGRFLHYRAAEDAMKSAPLGIVDLSGVVAIQEMPNGDALFVMAGDSFRAFGLPYDQVAKAYGEYEADKLNGSSSVPVLVPAN